MAATSWTIAAKVPIGTAAAGLGMVAAKKTWQRFEWHLRGRPECVVEIVQADLYARSNSRLDTFSPPDVQVTCWHGNTKRTTQTEGNCYNCRFLYQSKLPYHQREGFAFTVLDKDHVAGDEVIGRCYLDGSTADDGRLHVVSLGQGIGELTVRIQTAVDKDNERLQKED